MTAELKPCPFCGGDKNTICKTDYDGRDSYAVSCRYPECHGAIFTLGYGYFADEAEAIYNVIVDIYERIQALDIEAADYEQTLRDAGYSLPLTPELQEAA